MTGTAQPLRAALHAPVSADRQSTENQLRELRQAAARLGWKVVKTFVDRGISGAKGRNDSPQLDALLKGVVLRHLPLLAPIVQPAARRPMLVLRQIARGETCADPRGICASNAFF